MVSKLTKMVAFWQFATRKELLEFKKKTELITSLIVIWYTTEKLVNDRTITGLNWSVYIIAKV